MLEFYRCKVEIKKNKSLKNKSKNSRNPYRSSDSKLWALRSVTSVSVDQAEVDEEMDEAVEARLDEVVEDD